MAQDEQPGFGIKTNEMAAVISNTGLYPYNVYHIEVDDIDKQEKVQGELNIEIDILK